MLEALCSDGELLARLHVRQPWLVWIERLSAATPSLAHALRLARSRGLTTVDAITSLDETVRIDPAQLQRLLARLFP